MLGVGAYQLRYKRSVHSSFALLCFGCGALFVLVASTAEWRLKRALLLPQRAAICRCVLGLLLLLSFVPFVLLMLEFHKSDDKASRSASRATSLRAQLPHRASHVVADDVSLRRTLTRVAIRTPCVRGRGRGGVLCLFVFH